MTKFLLLSEQENESERMHFHLIRYSRTSAGCFDHFYCVHHICMYEWVTYAKAAPNTMHCINTPPSKSTAISLKQQNRTAFRSAKRCIAGQFHLLGNIYEMMLPLLLFDPHYIAAAAAAASMHIYMNICMRLWHCENAYLNIA